ncbi:MAG: ComEC/Rec2 family competence protein [Candidatus Latescibacterota bacterium]|nr:MAG: ComEC/Rec2 family competence protein [Candidatus Latescibacterota bacterium]
MTWGLAAAIAAGVAGDVRVLAVALFFFLRCSLQDPELGWARPRAVGAGVLAVLAAGSYLYGYAAVLSHAGKTAAFDRAAAAGDGKLCLDGWVASYPQYRYGGMAFEFETRVGDARQVPIRILVKSKEYVVGYGDSLRVDGHAYYAKENRRASYGRYLKGRALAGEIRAAGGGVVHLAGESGYVLTRRVFWPIHERVRCDVVRGLGARSGVPAALLIGERGFLNRKAPGIFADLGLSHLLALSGLHLGFVAAGFLLAARLTGRRNPLLLIVVLVTYVGIVGFIVSLVRALVMALLLIVASAVHRPLRPVSALGNALLLLLIIMPLSMFSLSFQLSFLATYGVLRCVVLLKPSPGDYSWARRLWLAVRSSLLVSLSAQLFVTPLILHYFEGVSLLSPLATMIFVLPVAAILTATAVCAGLSWICQPAASIGFDGLGWFVVWFGKSVEWAGSVSPDRVNLPAPDIYLYYGGLGLLFHANGGRWARSVGVVLLLIAFMCH